MLKLFQIWAMDLFRLLWSGSVHFRQVPSFYDPHTYVTAVCSRHVAFFLVYEIILSFSRVLVFPHEECYLLIQLLVLGMSIIAGS